MYFVPNLFLIASHILAYENILMCSPIPVKSRLSLYTPVYSTLSARGKVLLLSLHLCKSTQPPGPISRLIFPKKSSLLTCPEYRPPCLSFQILTVIHRLYKSYKKNLYGRKVICLYLVISEILSSLGQTCAILAVFKCPQSSGKCTSVFEGEKKINGYFGNS